MNQIPAPAPDSDLYPKSGHPLAPSEKRNPVREFSGKWVVGLLLGGAALLAVLVLGLFYFHFLDVLKEYRKTVPPMPRSVDRG